MKTKYIAFIFSLFLIITLASGLTVFLTKERGQSVVNKQVSKTEQPVETAAATTSAEEKIIQPKKVIELKKTEKTEPSKPVEVPAEEKIKAIMLINGFKYEAAVKPGSSVYDLMNELKIDNKINFSGRDYSGLGFFVEEINGVKNNPSGENWVYYINGQPAPVGISNYKLKNNDIIEWKYEEKSF
ncbi:MAG: DUF4430 domain-containing protein [Parcubacteria group bacterium]|nr:DUF4430 domain-containing protein [Parcubacteria group bacterium]